MSLALKASVISVGTEITSGEIVNRNASWISEHIEQVGGEVVWHLTVPDDRPLIRQALDLARKNSSLIFVTGGLGPTTDDFTREVIAEWLGVPLEFSESAWSELGEILKGRGLNVKQSHRQQCQFPRGCIELANPVGTAKGFYAATEGLHIYVLPGPPREIEGIWIKEVEPRLRSLAMKRDDQLHVWQVLGVPESEVADAVEECLKGSGYRIGYRAHVPYVFVKVWAPDNKETQSRLMQLEECLNKWRTLKGPEDPLARLVQTWLEMGSGPIQIVDAVTEGKFASRLEEVQRLRRSRGLRDFPQLTVTTAFAGRPIKALEAQPTFALWAGEDEERYRLEAKWSGQTWSEDRILPAKWKRGSERAALVISEEAVYTWLELLASDEALQ